MALVGLLVAVLIIVFFYFFSHNGPITPVENPKVIEKNAQDAVDKAIGNKKFEQSQVKNIDQSLGK